MHEDDSSRLAGLMLPWSVALVVKLVLAAVIPLAHDEAYYWSWGNHLDWSYFDHPPFVAWLFALGKPFTGLGTAVRWPAVILGHCTLLIWIQILRPSFSTEQIRWWFWLALLSPLVGLGSLIVIPDLPLLFWWSLSLLAFLRCLESPSPGKCVAFGLLLGLGFSSKYHMVLFVPCAIVAAFRVQKQSVLSPRNLLFVFVGGMAGAFPVWWWNLQNEFVSFRFQLGHGLESEAFKIKWPIEYVVGQFFLMFPPIFFLAIRRKTGDLAIILQSFAWLPLGFFLLTSFRASVEANWPIIAYPSVFALAVMEIHEVRWIRFTVRSWALAITVVLSIVIYPWVPVAREKLKTNELYQYDELAEAIEGQPNIFAHSYAMASQLSFKCGQPVYKLSGFGRVDFYDFVEEAVPTGDSFIVIVDHGQEVPEIDSTAGYTEVDRREVTDKFDQITFSRRSGDPAERRVAGDSAELQ